MHTIRAEATEAISDFAKRMVVEAYTRNDMVFGLFNEHTLMAKPGTKAEEVVSMWDRLQLRAAIKNQLKQMNAQRRGRGITWTTMSADWYQEYARLEAQLAKLSKG
jgi:hypothetical protein